MGYRIKRSIGWGMPWTKFVGYCRTPDTTNTSEWLYDTFNALTDKDLTIDPKLYRALFCDDGASFVFQKRLLAKDYEDIKTKTATGRAEDLFSITYNGDDYSDIVFYPNLTLRRRDDWLPGIPTEIRWYLTQHGIMFDEGVNQLRPIVTQWWS